MANHLAVELGESGARFVALNNQEVHRTYSVDFSTSKVEDQKNILSKAFEESNFLKSDFDDITLSWSHRRSTLVPNAVFAESTPGSIFQLCFGKEIGNEEIDYNRISELSIVNVYQIPLWIKSFFVIKYPRAILQHEGTHLLRKVLGGNAFKTKASIVFYKDYFFLSIVKHNQLEFYSFFDMQNADDVVYHVFFVLQQKEMENEVGTIELINGLNSSREVIDEVKSKFDRLSELKKTKITIENEFTAKAQLLCV